MTEPRAEGVLVADDDPRLLHTLRHLLESRGYRVEEAHDGDEALRRLQTDQFALVFLSLTMPKLSGDEVIRRLSPSFMEGTPVVLLTGECNDQDVMRGYAMGAAYCLVKPVNNEKVIDIADYLIGDGRKDDKDALRARL